MWTATEVPLNGEVVFGSVPGCSRCHPLYLPGKYGINSSMNHYEHFGNSGTVCLVVGQTHYGRVAEQTNSVAATVATLGCHLGLDILCECERLNVIPERVAVSCADESESSLSTYWLL